MDRSLAQAKSTSKASKVSTNFLSDFAAGSSVLWPFRPTARSAGTKRSGCHDDGMLLTCEPQRVKTRAAKAAPESPEASGDSDGYPYQASSYYYCYEVSRLLL